MAASVRASISFRPYLQALESIARRKKVSLAWVVLESIGNYIAGEEVLTCENASTEGNLNGVHVA